MRVNDIAVSDDKQILTLTDCQSDGAIKLSLGKKKHVLLKPI
jgi:tyrosyl-tRNA synthetase